MGVLKKLAEKGQISFSDYLNFMKNLSSTTDIQVAVKNEFVKPYIIKNLNIYN